MSVTKTTRTKRRTTADLIINALPVAPFRVQLVDIWLQTIQAQRPNHPTHHRYKAVIRTASMSFGRVGEASVRWTVQIGSSAAQEELALSFQALFHYDDDEMTQAVGTDEEAQIKAWLSRGMLSIVLPYIRENVHALSVRMGLEPIVLSLVAVAQEPEQEQAKEGGRSQ